jgi:HEAT repeat protein
VDGLLRAAFLALMGAAAAVTLAVVAARAVRLWLDRRRERLAAGPRRILLAFLADGGPADQLEQLVALRGPHWRALEPAATAMLAKVRGEARDALVTVFERHGVGDRALRDLRSAGPVRRGRAAEVLGNLRRRDAVPALCERLTDRDPDVRLAAVRALGRIGDAAAAGPLLATLATPDPAPVQLVAYALVQLAAGADGPLLAGLDHPDPQMRATILDTLRLRGTTGAEARVVEVLRGDPSAEVRRRAAAMLGRVGGRASLDPLVAAAAGDADREVRAAAAHALGDLGTPAAVPALRDLVGNRRYRVAHEAAAALVRLGAPGVATLRELAADGTAAAHALEALAAADLAAAR